ncbi:hypothetical protein [Novosphingobium sp. B1]|uniref:hypothetical protein n=1 Tax=Novosphingobium sp. B1 TaxID=1938756 RepID=UPI0009D82047|nr:hypothetical protein [Novosphingobium sp. B1]SMC31739.1 hypothetical protein SAMN06272759_101437 [Novosphingobium sp. B1]
MTLGWKLDRIQRDALLAALPLRYGRPVADHVTLSVSGNVLPNPVTSSAIVGHADDGQGVEAYVVEIDGSTARPDGGTWHITWSLAEGRAAKESNAVIADLGWTAISCIPVHLIPAQW